MTRTQIINKLFDTYNFNSYLEIGTYIPAHNFDLINAAFKESVDPWDKYHYTYNMNSDTFFEKYANDKKYDVIFIDGMHTAEQVYKDVHNSLNHLNENGFIVMHDCNPEQEFYIRPHEEWLKDGGTWLGTVFKGFIKLKSELSTYSCFVVNEDFGCGIITKKPILENISQDYKENLSWEEFNKNRDQLLQLISFEEYKKILK